MATIFETLKRMQKLPRVQRIEFLRSLYQLTPPRSVRHEELRIALEQEVRAQLKYEIRQGAAK